MHIEVAKLFSRTLSATSKGQATASFLADKNQDENLEEFQPIYPSQTQTKMQASSISLEREIATLKCSNEELYKLAVARTLNEF